MKVYYNWARSPWALTLTELVPETFEFPASDFFWPISGEDQLGEVEQIANLIWPQENTEKIFMADLSKVS